MESSKRRPIRWGLRSLLNGWDEESQSSYEWLCWGWHNDCGSQEYRVKECMIESIGPKNIFWCLLQAWRWCYSGTCQHSNVLSKMVQRQYAARVCHWKKFGWWSSWKDKIFLCLGNLVVVTELLMLFDEQGTVQFWGLWCPNPQLLCWSNNFSNSLSCGDLIPLRKNEMSVWFYLIL